MSLSAKLRKHRAALIALAVFHFAVFFPLIFMGRVVSPNDVFYAYEPWASHRPASVLRVQNPLMNDPPTAWLPLMSMMKSGADGTFHWDPYVGSGVPGFGSSGSAVLSPLILLPAFLVPLTWVYTAIIALKINVAFWFAYFWLREERLGKVAAAIGAIIIAGAGAWSVRWLWQSTNATVLYPAILWVVRRAFNGKRTPVAVVALLALAYALAGFPSTMAYGAYLAVAYALFLAIRERHLPLARGAELIGGALIALLIAMPFLVPFAQFIRRSGYLALRGELTARSYPWSHWRAFIDPQRLGNPVWKNWIGDPALGPLNNFIEASVFLGVVTIPLAALALFHRRKHRWFWVAATLVILLCMFGWSPLAGLVGTLPGFKYTALARLSMLLPMSAGFLAAVGASFLISRCRHRLRPAGHIAGLVIAGLLAWELGVFAGTFHPYLRTGDAAVPSTRVTEFLQGEAPPFRFAAFLTYLWPNSAQLYGIEDVASHFGSEATYRRILQRIDPTAWSGTSTVLSFNSLNFNFTDPLVSMLGVRYFLEHKPIDIIKWTIFKNTTPAVTETGSWVLSPGPAAMRTIAIDADPYWAIEVPANVESAVGAAPRLDVELVKNGTVAWSRTLAATDVSAINKVYVPVRPYARPGDRVQVRLWTNSMSVRLLKADAPAGEAGFYFGRVSIPLIFERELPEGRVFRNLAEVPRFHAVRRVRKLNEDEFLASKDLDFFDEAVITDDPVFPPQDIAAGSVKMLSYAAAEQRVETDSPGRMFLATSEKLTPELRVTIDGRPVRPIEINTMFAGVVVPAGKHEVRFTRRIGRGWWPFAIAGIILFLAVAAAEITFAWQRRRSDTRRGTATAA